MKEKIDRTKERMRKVSDMKGLAKALGIEDEGGFLNKMETALKVSLSNTFRDAADEMAAELSEIMEIKESGFEFLTNPSHDSVSIIPQDLVLDLGPGNEEHAFEVLSAFRTSGQLKTALVRKLPEEERGEYDVVFGGTEKKNQPGTHLVMFRTSDWPDNWRTLIHQGPRGLKKSIANTAKGHIRAAAEKDQKVAGIEEEAERLAELFGTEVTTSVSGNALVMKLGVGNHETAFSVSKILRGALGEEAASTAFMDSDTLFCANNPQADSAYHTVVIFPDKCSDDIEAVLSDDRIGDKSLLEMIKSAIEKAKSETQVNDVKQLYTQSSTMKLIV